MDDIPLSAKLGVLGVLLLFSAFFSMTETAMMASNRYRLRHLSAQGHRGATLALRLLGQTDKMLGVILLGNNLVNAGAATLVSVLTIEFFGEDELALGAGTLLITFVILVFSEITPKIIAATHSDRLATMLSWCLAHPRSAARVPAPDRQHLPPRHQVRSRHWLRERHAVAGTVEPLLGH